MASGYVRYYKDPLKHPKRQYIGVALEKDQQLPYPVNMARPRKLGMVAVTAPQVEAPAVEVVEEGDQVVVVGGANEKSKGKGVMGGKVLTMGSGYAYREANWQIGRSAERAGVEVRKFVPGDRWTAWKRSQARIRANEEKKRLRSAGKKGGAKKKDVRR
jgi:large subunit ribosomal protein L27